MNYEFNHIGKLDSSKRVITQKAWGWEEELWNSSSYCGKVLNILKYKETSYHYHKIKDETLLVAEGKILIRYCPYIFPLPACKYEASKEWIHSTGIYLSVGDTFHVPVYLRHQLIASKMDCKVIEFSTHHEDSDSYRIIFGSDTSVKLAIRSDLN